MAMSAVKLTMSLLFTQSSNVSGRVEVRLHDHTPPMLCTSYIGVVACLPRSDEETKMAIRLEAQSYWPPNFHVEAHCKVHCVQRRNPNVHHQLTHQ